jgi:hypothetical protein
VRNLIRESDADEPSKPKRADQATATG